MNRALPSATVAAACLALAACASTSSSDATTDVVLLPNVQTAAAELQSGCWVTFYDERSYGGSSLTLVGDTRLDTLDKGSAQQLKRDIKSIATGPRATLTVYQKQFLSARYVAFGPDTREPGLAEKLGFGGRIESLQLRCPS